MKKIASYKTLNTNSKTRRVYAYNAIERAWFQNDEEDQPAALEAMDRLVKKEMPKAEMMGWASQEAEYRSLSKR